MIILILLGLIQALILPGLICSYYVKNIDYRDRIVLASALSLLLNYLIVWFLYGFNLYSQQSIFIVLAIELLLILKLIPSIIQDLSTCYNHLINTLNAIAKTKTVSLYFLLFVLFCVYYFYLLKTSGFLTVFTHWDAVVSWNRWAVELHDGTFQGSLGYPLAISILFSIIYTIANESNIQTLVKYICVFWPFIGGIAIFVAGLHASRFKNLFGVAALFYLYLLSKGSWTIDFIFSGLVDPIMAAYGAIFIYSCLLLISSNTRQHPQSNKIIALVTLSIVGSALTKMTGVILVLYFLLFIYFIFIHNNKLKKSNSFLISLFIISIILALHWYILTTFYWRDWKVITDYSSLQDSRIWIRPYLHLVLFGSTFGWLFTVLIFVGLFSSRKIFLSSLLLITPLFLFCSVTVGYDLRATFVLFAPFSILAALGIAYISQELSKLHTHTSRLLSSSKKISLYSSVAIGLIAFISIPFALMTFMPNDKILSSNTEKRIAANNFASNGNQRLIKIFESEPDSRIISCWQTPFGLPGAQGRFIPTGNCTITLLQAWLADDNIKYWLYRDEGSSSQALTPEFVAEYLSRQPIQIQSEALGSGFVLYSKTNSSKKVN